MDHTLFMCSILVMEKVLHTYCWKRLPTVLHTRPVAAQITQNTRPCPVSVRLQAVKATGRRVEMLRVAQAQREAEEEGNQEEVLRDSY